MNKLLTAKQEEEIVELYLSGLSCERISSNYNVSWQTIRNTLIKRDVKLRFNGKKSKLSSSEILEMYSNGTPIEEIVKKAEVDYQSIYKRLKKEGVKFPRGMTRKHEVNESYFDSWSFEMAYIFGFIVADGNMAQNRLRVTITQKEKQILYEIAKKLGMSKESVTHKNDQYTLNIYSVKICKSLFWLGITPNKSLTIEFPYVPKFYMGAFLRGVIDGDGWVDSKRYRVVIYSGSKNFAEGICNALKELNLENARIRRGKKGCYEITVSKKTYVNMLGEIIYKNKGNLYLDRKYQRFYSPRAK